jgi:predicted DNA repair protein MutK
MIGGAFLCFEGVEKLAHKFLHPAAEDAAHEAELMQALADPQVDLAALEKDKVKGAIRTDFVLSAEIIAITLGTVQSSDWMTQLSVLSGIAVLMTFGVYGIVAGIVKIDDAGLYLSRRLGNDPGTKALQSLGRGLLIAAPWLMRFLSVAGTAAMFLVGGGILTHGLPPLHHGVQDWVAPMAAPLQAVLPVLADVVIGVVAGALVLATATLGQKLRKNLSK